MEKKSTNTIKDQIYYSIFSDIINGVYPIDTILKAHIFFFIVFHF
ncbi:hypothetical protein [Clostridium felsineum]|nr:hypothetical protein [Clostridium felsineum]